VLENGRVVLSDRAAVLVDSPELEAAFLGRDLSRDHGTRQTIAASERREE